MRSVINTLRFIPFWKTISGGEHVAKFRPVWDLKREPTKCDRFAIEVSTEFNSDQKHWNDVIEETIDQLLLESGSKSSAQLQWDAEGPARNEAAKAEKAAENTIKNIITLGDDEDDAPEVGNQRRKSGKKNKKNRKNQKKNDFEAAVIEKKQVEPIVIDDEEEVNSSLQKKFDALKAENEKLKEINKQMYEFVAKEIVDSEK